MFKGARFHITFDFGYVALDISHIYPEDAGNYTARASNSLGEDQTSIDIEVISMIISLKAGAIVALIYN